MGCNLHTNVINRILGKEEERCNGRVLSACCPESHALLHLLKMIPERDKARLCWVPPVLNMCGDGVIVFRVVVENNAMERTAVLQGCLKACWLEIYVFVPILIDHK